MTDLDALISSQTPTSPWLSRLAWLAEQLQQSSEQIAVMFRDDELLRTFTGAEFDALRHAASAARTAGADVLLVATAVHHRVRQNGGPQEGGENFDVPAHGPR